ncbi:MAG: dephospho-CoA kinase [Bacteroidia bacterium]
MKKIIGITGGIGSGKTTVAKHLASLGYRIYIADERAKAVMNENQALIKALTDVFGEQTYLNGELNRPYIGNLIFQNKALLQQMNALVHPAVRADFHEWIENTPADYPFQCVIREAAILFEANVAQDCWKIMTVYAPKKVRLQRAVQRDALSEADILKKMANQWADLKKIQASDYVVINDGKYDWKNALEKQMQAWEGTAR